MIKGVHAHARAFCRSVATTVVSLENALRHGMSSEISHEILPPVLMRQWSSIRGIINESETVIWLGCIEQPEALAIPLELAQASPEMTIIAANTCNTTDSKVSGISLPHAMPPNLLVARGSPQSANVFSDDDEVETDEEIGTVATAVVAAAVATSVGAR